MGGKSSGIDWRILRVMRNELRMTQAFVAQGAGLSQGYLSQVEAGDVANPSIKVISGLATTFGIPLHYLLRRAGIDCGCLTYRDGAVDLKEISS